MHTSEARKIANQAKASSRFEPASLPPIGGRFDVPFAIGRSR
jgi:hypothetical protein